jgi:LEA14-like dessication related protein
MKKDIFIPILILLFTITLGLTGCSSLKKAVESPKITLDNIRVVNLGLLEAQLDVVLNIANPNSIDFDVKGLTYVLDINSKQVTSGTLKEPVKVLANKTTTVSLPLAVKYSDVLSSALKLLQKDGLPYHILGKVQIGPFNIPFDKEGMLKDL